MNEPTKTDIFFAELSSLEATVLVLSDRHNELNGRFNSVERENLKLKVELNNMRTLLEKKHQETQALEQKIQELETAIIPNGEHEAVKQKLVALLEKINKQVPESGQ